MPLDPSSKEERKERKEKRWRTLFVVQKSLIILEDHLLDILLEVKLQEIREILIQEVAPHLFLTATTTLNNNDNTDNNYDNTDNNNDNDDGLTIMMMVIIMVRPQMTPNPFL